jgi:hypothetical protein
VIMAMMMIMIIVKIVTSIIVTEIITMILTTIPFARTVPYRTYIRGPTDGPRVLQGFCPQLCHSPLDEGICNAHRYSQDLGPRFRS